MENQHNYEKVNSVKVIIESEEGKILLIQEPAADEWMPLHWGLPGGRPMLKESLHAAFKRTIQEEIGLDLEPLGLYKIEEVLHEDRTALMFIVVTKISQVPEIKGRINAYKWVDQSEVEKMATSEFTAYYAKKLILDYLAGNREYKDLSLIETQEYYGLDQDPEFQRWLESDKQNDKSQS